MHIKYTQRFFLPSENKMHKNTQIYFTCVFIVYRSKLLMKRIIIEYPRSKNPFFGKGIPPKTYSIRIKITSENLNQWEIEYVVFLVSANS